MKRAKPITNLSNPPLGGCPEKCESLYCSCDRLKRSISVSRIHNIRDTITMHALIRKKRRAIGWMLTVAMLLLTTVSTGSWRCRDGTPCSADCPMLHGSARPVPIATPAPEGACSRCPSRQVSLRLPGSKETLALSDASRCLFTQSEPPASSLQDRAPLPTTDADIPSLPSFAPLTVANRSFPCVPPRSPPQRVPAPCASRAPPSLLF